jgi:hypothetical protein
MFLPPQFSITLLRFEQFHFDQSDRASRNVILCSADQEMT